MSELMVYITRHPYDHEGSAIDISEIANVKWDSVSGGVKRKQSGHCLYGYIDYKLAKKLVKCSGQHDFGNNQAKICIPESSNTAPIYKAGYKVLLEMAGPKPQSQIASRRPAGYPPCTQRILQVLETNSSITRKELRNLLITDGYYTDTIRNALNQLKKQSNIVLHGSPNSPKQLIEIAK